MNPAFSKSNNNKPIAIKPNTTNKRTTILPNKLIMNLLLPSSNEFMIYFVPTKTLSVHNIQLKIIEEISKFIETTK